MRIAVVGRGSAGSLAAAIVSRRLPGHELHHIYDSRIPVIGVGEGTLPGLVNHLCNTTGLDHATVQSRLHATRKYGVRFEGWGRANRRFIHDFADGKLYGYHLSADTLVELLSEHTEATHLDARVTRIARTGAGVELELDSLRTERFDLVFDARGYPGRLNDEQHARIDFIPTNAAVARRAAALDVDANHTYTRAVARPNGWIFVIPLCTHTSYGYVFNRHIADVAEVERDFDVFLNEERVTDWEQRAVIRFPNYIHRSVYDGGIARIGNAAGFMEPLEATALGLIQVQIDVILGYRELVPADEINRLLVQFAWRFGVFIAWHYSRGSVYDSPFWRYARDEAWPRHRVGLSEPVVDSEAESSQLKRRIELATKFLQEGGRRPSADPYALFYMSSFVRMTRGLGLAGSISEPARGVPRPARHAV